MSFSDIIKNSVIEGFSYSGITTGKMLVTLVVTFLIGVYIFLLYRFMSKRSFYDRNFNVSMAVISVVTAGIILAMQSNIVISLGMVGALSIVRFRTAIKEPMDLLFLFWSIGTGIICGASLYKLAIIVAMMVTIGILILQMIPMNASPYLLIIDSDKEAEQDIMDIIKEFTNNYRLDSKRININGVNMIIEVRTKNESDLVNRISEVYGVSNVNLIHHDGEVKS